MSSLDFKNIFFFFFLAYCSNTLKAQLGEERLSSLTPKYSHQYSFLKEERFYFIDTSFNSLHWYHQFNHTGKDIFEYSILGNMGSALNQLSIPKKRSLWSNYDFISYNPYFQRQSNIPFYYTRSPLTEANYWMGYDRGQSFNIYHTQNINRNWNFLVKYSRLHALGFYTHNRNRQTSFLANSHYNDGQNGYRAHMYFLNEKMEIEEFGGIANDSVFENNLEIGNPRMLMAVNLQDDMRVMRNQEFFIDQRIALNKVFKNKATELADSVITEDEGNVQNDGTGNTFELGHSFMFSRKSSVYRGFSEDFYSNYYYSNSDYNDSSSYRAFHNTIYLEGNVGKQSNLNVKAGFKNLTTEYTGENFLFTGSNWGLTGTLSGRIKEYVDVQGTVDYILSGPLNQSFDVGVVGKVKLFRNIKAFGGYTYKLQYPTFFEQFYYSNNFIWQNNLEKEGRSDLKYGLKWGKDNRIEFTNFISSNYVYFNENAVPEQSQEPVNIFKAELVQKFTLWNFLHQDNRIVYQRVAGNADALPLPEVVTRNSIYFEFKLFGSLKCLWGAEMKYFTPYNSPSYMPATGAFYNANEREIGGYPLLDAFANFEIAKARIFVKYEHINEGFSGYTYYAAPRYPFADRVLRVGITWRFFN